MFVRHAPFAGQNRRQGRDEKMINKALRWRALLTASAKCVDWEMPSEMTTTRRNTENSRSRVCLKTARRLVSSFLFRGSWIFHAAYVQVKQKSSITTSQQSSTDFRRLSPTQFTPRRRRRCELSIKNLYIVLAHCTLKKSYSHEGLFTAHILN